MRHNSLKTSQATELPEKDMYLFYDRVGAGLHVTQGPRCVLTRQEQPRQEERGARRSSTLPSRCLWIDHILDLLTGGNQGEISSSLCTWLDRLSLLSGQSTDLTRDEYIGYDKCYAHYVYVFNNNNSDHLNPKTSFQKYMTYTSLKVCSGMSESILILNNFPSDAVRGSHI